MVDYNIAIPQQQLFQAPDMMQNAMRMQQMQAQNAQMGELARQRAEENALRGITADPNSHEYIQQVARISPKLGMQALNLQRQASMFNQQGEAARLQAEKTNLDISAGRLDLIRKFNADLPGVLTSANPPAAYAAWRARIKQVTGQEPGVPEVYPGEPALRGIMDTTDAFLTRTTPQPREVAGAFGTYDPKTNTFNEAGVNRFVPPADTGVGAGAGTGPATAAMNPDRLAAMQATQARLGLPPMQPSAAGANAAVNNMPGAGAAAPVVGNAMVAPPTTEAGGKNTLRAGPISAGDFALQQEAQKEQRKAQAAQTLTPVQEQKMRTDIGEARANAGESMATLQETLRAAKDVLALPEETKNAISGYTGKYTPNLSASAKDAQTKFNDVVGQITAMSKASAGSIGSMAVQEWKILADQVASLDLTNMDAKTLDRQMKIIINRAEGLMNRTRSNYTNIYGPLMEKYKGQFDLPAATPSIAADIDPRAIEKLRNDPSMAKAFDEHFGRPGAAAAILGK